MVLVHLSILLSLSNNRRLVRKVDLSHLLHGSMIDNTKLLPVQFPKFANIYIRFKK